MTELVLVIGAGITGMTVAVGLADSGIDTILVEQSSSTGGNALDLYKAFPTDDCFYCFEGNRSRPGIRKCFYRSAMIDQERIELLINTTVEEVARNNDTFSVKLKIGPRYVDPKKCIMCGICLDHSDAFRLLSPQCQPQAVTYDPTKTDEKAKKAEEECPTKAINLSAESEERTVKVSDIVMATGYHEMQPIDVDNYAYGTHPNIITQLELAKILDPNNESGGVLVRPSDGKAANRVMMVQCVGSRDENYFPFCSKICCVFALKHANIIAAERGNITVSIVYMDIRTYDRHERYYRMARELGVEFIRGRIAKVEPQDNTIDVIAYDSLLDKYLKLNVDLVVLSSALEPPEHSDRLIKALGLKSASGFIGPLDLVSESEVVAGDRIYACGTALGPAEIPECVTQARAVVSRILQSRK